MHLPVLDGSFLSLSRDNHNSVQQPSQFTIDTGIEVKIFGPGVLSFTPEKLTQKSKSIVLSCGIHGNETAPIELCDKLVSDILSGVLVPIHRVLVIFGNLPAMDIAKRFVDENLNRLFCNKHSEASPQNTETRRAAFLEECMQQFFSLDDNKSERLHYDLHTAIRESKNEKFAVYPYLHGKPYSRGQIRFLVKCGVNTILLSQSTTATFSYYSSTHFSAHSFTVELGKVKPFGENDMAKFALVDSALRSLITEYELPMAEEMDDLLLYVVNQVITKQSDVFTLNFADDAPNFSTFNQGELIARDADRHYLAQYDEEAIVFPNANVPVGQRALLTAIPVSIDDINTRV